MAKIGEVKKSSATVFEFEWSIPEFASLSAEDSRCYSSPSFEVLGESCTLFIYPNDCRSSTPSVAQKYSLRYVVIGVGLCSSQKSLIVPEISFAIRNADGNKHEERHDPCQRIHSESLQYSAYRYISRTELLERASELMPSNILTVTCTVKYTESIDSKSNSGTSKCVHCKGILGDKAISFHEKNCRDKPVKYLECSEDVVLSHWSDHAFQSTKKAGETGSAKCKRCQELVDAKTISLHEKKCLIKCPECSEVVAFKNWHDHECHTTISEGGAATAQCCYCKEMLDSESMPSHEKRCIDKPIKCSDCSEVTALGNWYEHQCQITKSNDEESLTEDFKKVLLDGRNHDLILKMGDVELRAHRDILRARSHVFQSMLDHDMKEKESGVVDVHDCDPQAMELFLSYIYTGKVEALDQSNMLSLYYVADKYDMQDLKDNCCEFIKKSLSITNICDVIQLALSHSNTGLLEYATEFFMENTLEIMVTVEWQSFLTKNTTVGNELLLKSFRKVKS